MVRDKSLIAFVLVIVGLIVLSFWAASQITKPRTTTIYRFTSSSARIATPIPSGPVWVMGRNMDDDLNHQWKEGLSLYQQRIGPQRYRYNSVEDSVWKELR